MPQTSSEALRYVVTHWDTITKVMALTLGIVIGGSMGIFGAGLFNKRRKELDRREIELLHREIEIGRERLRESPTINQIERQWVLGWLARLRVEGEGLAALVPAAGTVESTRWSLRYQRWSLTCEIILAQCKPQATAMFREVQDPPLLNFPEALPNDRPMVYRLQELLNKRLDVLNAIVQDPDTYV